MPSICWNLAAPGDLLVAQNGIRFPITAVGVSDIRGPWVQVVLHGKTVTMGAEWELTGIRIEREG